MENSKEKVLEKIHAEWIAKGSKEPSQVEAKKVLEKAKNIYLKISETEKVLENLKKESYLIAKEVATLFGKRSFTLTGLGNAFLSSRGENVFLKFESSDKERVKF